MPVRGVDDEHVDAGVDQRLDALLGVAAGSDGGADAQAAELVLRRERMLGRLEDVLDGDEPAQFHRVVDDQHALEAVPVHQRLGALEIGALGHRHELVALGHDARRRLIEIRLEAQIAIGDDADDALAVDDGQSGDPMPSRQREDFAHRHRRRNRDRVLDHAAFEALDLRHFGRLLRGRHVLVHYTQAAFLRDGDREPGFGDGVHCRRQQRNVERDACGEAGLEADVVGNDEGMRGNEQDVVERQRLPGGTHLIFSYAQKRIIPASAGSGKPRRARSRNETGRPRPCPSSPRPV